MNFGGHGMDSHQPLHHTMHSSLYMPGDLQQQQNAHLPAQVTGNRTKREWGRWFSQKADMLLRLQLERKVRWILTAEGKNYTMQGSLEVQVFEAVPAEGISPAGLKGKLDALVYDVGFKTVMKNKWLQTTKGLISKKVEHVKDEVRNLLTDIQDGKWHGGARSKQEAHPSGGGSSV